MRSRTYRVLATSLVLVTAVALLVWATPSDLLRDGISGADAGRPHTDQLVAAAGALLAWLLLLWLTISSALTALGGLPGASGRVAGALARRVTPTLVRRAVEAALGAAIVGTSIAPAAALAAPRQPAAVQSAARAHAQSRPLVSTVTYSEVTTSPYDRPSAAVPQTETALPVPVDAVATAGRPEHDPAVVVRRGDTLWSIAARALGHDANDAAIDAEWRRWYAANREAIGTNPDLISPGLRLLPPTLPSQP